MKAGMADNDLQSGEQYLALSCAQSLENEILPTKPEMLGDGGLHPLRSVPKKIVQCCEHHRQLLSSRSLAVSLAAMHD